MRINLYEADLTKLTNDDIKKLAKYNYYELLGLNLPENDGELKARAYKTEKEAVFQAQSLIDKCNTAIKDAGLDEVIKWRIRHLRDEVLYPAIDALTDLPARNTYVKGLFQSLHKQNVDRKIETIVEPVVAVKESDKKKESASAKPLSKNPTPEEVIEYHVAKIKELELEYRTRKDANASGNKTALPLSAKVVAFFNPAFSASDKAAAIGTIKKSIPLLDSKILINLANNNQAIDLSELPPAARQGRLGKHLSAIADAQKQIIDRKNKLSP